MAKKYFIKTFGCAQNVADSERIKAAFTARGMIETEKMKEADQIVINTCMVREMAENRVYGLVNNLKKFNPATTGQNSKFKIILTGCMVGMAVRDKTGKFLQLLKKRMPVVDEFLPIEEVGFDHAPLRTDKINAWVPVSNGCNNFCTFCVVPFTRGREISRPFAEIMNECKKLAKEGYKKITLLGMNVNSYGADLILGTDNIQVMRDLNKTYFENSKTSPQIRDPAEAGQFKTKNYKNIKPVYVKHLGRLRIPTLFPHLLARVCKIEGIETVDFLSSNPWDFSDDLIEVISRNPKITRTIHLPVQSGSNTVLKRMNRWYTRNEYLKLVANLKLKIKNLKLSTDIIVGFCGETKEEFHQTVDLAQKVGFYKAYIAMYSDRPATTAHKVFQDDIPHKEKKRRWQILEELINQPNLKKLTKSLIIN